MKLLHVLHVQNPVRMAEVAHVAGIGSLSRVGSPVQLKHLFGVESFFAEFAFVVALLGVHQHVVLKP